MAILVVGAVTVKVAGPEGAERRIDEYGGDRARMFDGGMRETVRGRKSSWQVSTKLLTTAEKNSLETALTATPPITCSGDLLGASTSCFAKIDGIHPVAKAGGETRWRFSFTLFQQ